MNEEFEKMWNKNNELLTEIGIDEDSEYNKHVMQHYFLAGAAAMREQVKRECIEMAYKHGCPIYDCRNIIPKYIADMEYKQDGRISDF